MHAIVPRSGTGHSTEALDQSSTSILILPPDMIKRICISHRDLCSLTLACTRLYKMRNYPEIQMPLRDFKAINLFSAPEGIDNIAIMEVIQAVNKRPLNLSESVAVGVAHINDFENELKAKDCEWGLLSLFNNRCAQFSIKQNSEEFVYFAKIIVEKLKCTCAYLNMASESMHIKLGTTAANFLDRVSILKGAAAAAPGNR